MFDIIIYTPTRTLFEGKAKKAVFPGEQGVFEVLPYHKPLVSRLISGTVLITGVSKKEADKEAAGPGDAEEQSFSIARGIIGVNRNRTTVVVEEA